MKMSDWSAYILVHHALAALYKQGKRVIDSVKLQDKLFHLKNEDGTIDANFCDKISFQKDERGNWLSKNIERGLQLCTKSGVARYIGDGKYRISFTLTDLKETLSGLSKKEFHKFMEFASDLNWFGKKKKKNKWFDQE